MNVFDRMSNGWSIALNSLKVIRANKQLIIFPLLSGLALVLVMGSFVGVLLTATDGDLDNLPAHNDVANYAILFGFYLINYFIITFFNMALVHCTHLYFKGEEASVQDGIRFSMSRLKVILSWALFAATVGFILKVIQENVGWIGKIITSVIGVVWSIATFFVVPVIAYENMGPIAAIKRSTQMMRKKWGESLGAQFSFGLINLAGLLLIVLPLFLVGFFVHVALGIVLGLLGLFLITAVLSAARIVFISAVYHNLTGDPVEHFNQQMVDGLFQGK